MILGKIIKIAATRCHILKMHQIRFLLGLRPRPRWGSLQRSPDPLAGFNGPTSKEREGEERRRGGERKGWEGIGGEDKGGQGKGPGRETGGREGKWLREGRDRGKGE